MPFRGGLCCSLALGLEEELHITVRRLNERESCKTAEIVNAKSVLLTKYNKIIKTCTFQPKEKYNLQQQQTEWQVHPNNSCCYDKIITAKLLHIVLHSKLLKCAAR